MKFLLPVITCLFIFFAPSGIKAQQANPKTLLWRISGNGMQKPSYLYGTMHLKDRRLFFFGDSVYNGIESSAGFAMELDPDEMMDSVFTKIGEKDTTTLLRKLLDDKKYKSVSKKLEKKFGMPADKITRKKLIEEREGWYYKVQKPDDMKTAVDLYLYDIAHRQGKWVGGIEDVSDQFGIQDELGKDINIATYVDDDDDEKRKGYLEQMIAIYCDQDLALLDKMASGSQSKKSNDLLLVNRNIKMAYRMDSLAHIRNSFFAVGAAHLPGETGLIKLLQTKGFTVTPVFSSKKLAPEKYTYQSINIPWVTYQEPDSAYTVEMPGKASDLKVPGIDINFKVYADLVTNTFYMTSFSFYGTEEKPGDILARMVKSFSEKGYEKIEEKKITNNGIEGVELTAIVEKLYYRLQVFALQDKFYLLLAGGERKENIYSKDTERFLKSLAMNSTLSAKPINWITHSEDSKAFEVSFPKKPGIDKLKAGETDKNFETTTYTALDIAGGTYYMVVVSETKPGYIITEDSFMFNAKLNFYRQKNLPVKDLRYFKYEGYNAMSFSGESVQEGQNFVSKMTVICRGNRSYTIAAIAQKGREDYPDITRFFRSFKLNPYRQSDWAVKQGPQQSFKTWAPSDFRVDQPDTTGLTEEEKKAELSEAASRVQILAHEPHAATTYNVNIYPVSKYYWTKTDSSFLAEQASSYYTDSSADYARKNPGNYDSLVYKKYISNGNKKGIELLVKNSAKPYFKRFRLFAQGDSTYHLFSMGIYDMLFDKNNNRFFEDFRFTNETLASNILANKTPVIIADLSSTDSATREAAIETLGKANFELGDLPLLYKAYLKQYPVDSTAYNSINENISDAINKLHDSSTVHFVKENYLVDSPHIAELRMDMLDMLAEQKTTSAVNSIKELLLKSVPVASDKQVLFYDLADSLKLATGLFPEMGRYFGDSILGAGMIRLASDLIDSSLLKKDILDNYMDGIFRTADRQLTMLKKDKYDYPVFNGYVIDLLGKLNNLKSNTLLNGFVKYGDLYIKQGAIIALLKNNQPVPALEVRKIVADKEYRTSFHDELVKIKKQQFYPAEFFTQPYFAEGYVYNNVSDDETEDIICKLVGERIASIKGKQYRYYLFKVSFLYDGETESHLAVCGKFSLDKKKVEVQDDDFSFKVFYSEKFSATSVNKLFNSFIKTENAPEEK